MKKVFAVILALLLSAPAFAGCRGKNFKFDDPANGVAFQSADLVNADFAGIGAEWDAFANPALLTDQILDDMYKRAAYLKPGVIRCMYNMAVTVLPDGTWEPNFKTPQFMNLLRLLDFCMETGVSVAYGAWGVWGDGLNLKDFFADPEYARICARFTHELVNVRGYTCIKWFIGTNEPNYSSVYYINPGWDGWVNLIYNLWGAFAEYGLNQKVRISGPDAANHEEGDGWLVKTAQTVGDKIGNYGLHAYVTPYAIDGGMYRGYAAAAKKGIIDNDAAYKSKSKQFMLWELGLSGYTAQGHPQVGTYSYGCRSSDMTLQAIMGGVDGISWWLFDDGNHAGSSADIAGAYGMGMYISIGDASQYELRPWYYSTAMATRAFKPHCKIYTTAVNDEKDDKDRYGSFRALASVEADGKNGHVFAVNRAETAVTKTFAVGPKITGADTLYIYIYSENDMRLDSEGWLLPNYTLQNASLNKPLTVVLPPQSVLLVTTQEIK